MASSAPVINIALTGRIGSGKSTVAEIFRTLAVPVLDLDAVGRSLQQQPQVISQIAKIFGCHSRADLAAACFADRNKMEQLEAIMHPLIWQQAILWIQQQHASYGMIEASALRTKHASIHSIVTVTASTSIRQQRVIARGKQDTETFARINQLQQPLQGDFTINNGGDRQMLLDQVSVLHGRLLNLANQP